MNGLIVASVRRSVVVDSLQAKTSGFHRHYLKSCISQGILHSFYLLDKFHLAVVRTSLASQCTIAVFMYWALRRVIIDKDINKV
jgi:hypothetical protein